MTAKKKRKKSIQNPSVNTFSLCQALRVWTLQPSGVPDAPEMGISIEKGEQTCDEDGIAGFASQLIEDSAYKSFSNDLSYVRFNSKVSSSVVLSWRGFLWRKKLFVEIKPGPLPEGSKIGFIELLELAEEDYNCEFVFVCFKKDRSDRACLMKTFMFMGFIPVKPDHEELIPYKDGYMFLAYEI